ncbi:MAG: hypothetical protein IJV33_08165 [Bacteroidaceae bacterium]|nr:hypothetical protein [Bacteroidaceae bacterium]
MKVNNIHHICIALCITSMLSLSACSDDDGQETRQLGQRQMSLTLCPQQLQATASSPTRALPFGYETLTTPSRYARIWTFIAPQEGTDAITRIFSLDMNGASWQSNLTLSDTSNPYYIYGFTPTGTDTSSDIAIDQLEGHTGYAAGAQLTIRNLQAVTAQDPCVIVGVKKGDDSNTPINDIDIRLGNFSYKFADTVENEYAYLLLNHLFGAFHFEMKINETYAQLRTIVIKSLRLTALAPSTVQAIVALNTTANGTTPLVGDNAIQFTTPDAATEGTPFTLYETSSGTDEPLSLTTSYQPIRSEAIYIAPSIQNFRLTTLYDVYDRKGNLIRKDCTADNNFSLSHLGSELKSGYRHTIHIEVNPTFLYVLSEPDLDSPTFTVE